MLSCPVLKQFAVLLSRRSQYRSRASHQKARSKALDLASTQLDRLDGVPALPAQVSVCEGKRRQKPLAMRQRRETAERTGSLRTQSARHRVDHGTICGRSCANSGHYKPLCACVDRFSSGDGPVRLGLVASHRHQFFCNFQPRLSMLTSVLNNAWSGPFPADRGAPSQHNDG